MLIVYTKPGCMPCKMTRRKLDEMGVDYETRDVIGDDAAMDEVRALGYREMPVVVNGQDHWSGFRPDNINEVAG